MAMHWKLSCTWFSRYLYSGFHVYEILMGNRLSLWGANDASRMNVGPIEIIDFIWLRIGLMCRVLCYWLLRLLQFDTMALYSWARNSLNMGLMVAHVPDALEYGKINISIIQNYHFIVWCLASTPHNAIAPISVQYMRAALDTVRCVLADQKQCAERMHIRM